MLQCSITFLNSERDIYPETYEDTCKFQRRWLDQTLWPHSYTERNNVKYYTCNLFHDLSNLEVTV
jgi:hypothetical protein